MYALVYQINCEGARVHPWQYLIVFFLLDTSSYQLHQKHDSGLSVQASQQHQGSLDAAGK